MSTTSNLNPLENKGSEGIIYTKGTPIYDEYGVYFCSFAKDIYEGDSLTIDQFENYLGTLPKEGDEAPHCIVQLLYRRPYTSTGSQIEV